MIKRRFSLALSLLWRTYVVFFIYSIVISLALGFAFSLKTLVNSSFSLYLPAGALLVFALLLAVLEVGCRINLLRAMFGGRLKRSPAQWRTCVLQLSLVITTLATLNALIAFVAPIDVWVYYKAYVAQPLFAVGVFAIGWAQATSGAEETSAALAVN